MLILIVIDVQYSQKVVFSFENGSNRKNQSSSRCLHLVKKFPTSKISDSNLLLGGGGAPFSHPPLNAIWKNLNCMLFSCEYQVMKYF